MNKWVAPLNNAVLSISDHCAPLNFVINIDSCFRIAVVIVLAVVIHAASSVMH